MRSVESVHEIVQAVLARELPDTVEGLSEVERDGLQRSARAHRLTEAEAFRMLHETRQAALSGEAEEIAEIARASRR